MKKRYWMVGLGSFVVTLALFLTLLFPLWDKRFDVFNIHGKDREPLGPLEVYGVMPAATTSTYEWDAEEGQNYFSHENVIRLNDSEYYLIGFRGESGVPENDAYLRTIRVWNNNGTIRPAVIDTYEISNYDTHGICIKYISGTDKYVVTYYDQNAGKNKASTVQVWANNGTIKKSKIDTITFTDDGSTASLVCVADDVFAYLYGEGGSGDGYMETFKVNSDGTIDDALLDFEEFDAVWGWGPSAVMVDSDTIAIAYYMNTGTYNGYLATYNISSAGVITDTPASTWTFQVDRGVTPHIVKISGNVFAIAYRGTGSDGFISTVTIADSGAITKAFIDTLEFLNADTRYPFIFPVNDASTSVDGNGVYGISFQDDTSDDGWIYTMNITAAGQIGAAIIDSLEFDGADTFYHSPVVWVNQSWYLVVYEGTGNDGWSRTVNILTNWAEPVLSNEYPVDESFGVEITPTCSIDVSDWNGDSLNILWEAFVGAAWVHKQTNNSVGNGTYRWVYSDASSYSTGYSWRVSVSDGMHNVSAVYFFTTIAEPVSESWQVISSSLNGSIYNFTLGWRVVDSSLNGSIYNSSKWNVISSSLNGSVYNTSKWNVLSSSLNGSIYNVSGGWHVLDSSLNGSIYNLSSWTVVDSSLNGSIWNRTLGWRVLDSSLNGSIYNVSSGWSVISSSVNGSIFNSSRWVVVSSSLNGSIFNRSSWVVIDSSINGSIYNTSLVSTPFNINLYVHNPNPGNGTHSTNYLKRDSAGLTTSVDVVYKNFTSPGALIPGDYSLTVVGTSPSNGPNIQNVSPVYADAYNNLTGQIISGQLYTGQFLTAGDYCIVRSFLSFNTSSLPDEAVIDSMHVQLVVFADYSDTDFRVSLQTVKPPMPHNPLIPIDYERHAFPVLATVGQRDTSGVVPGGYFNISINASGINDVNFTGYTYWVVRSNQDIIASVPVGDEWIGFYAPGGVHPEYGPRLIVNYSISGSNWQHIVNLSWMSNSSGPWVEYNRSFVTGNGTVTVFNSNFSNVSGYFWYVGWDSNSTNVGYSTVFEFETVSSGGGGFIVVNIESRMALGLVVGIMFAVPFVVLFRRRKRDEHE